MLADIGKYVGNKVAGVLITLGILAGLFWCYQNWDTVKAFGHVVKLTLFWLFIVAALPWTSYVFMRPLIQFQGGLTSPTAASALSIGVIAAYSLIDIVFALYLADWSITGGFTWFVVLLGFAAAAAYNFVICESLARYVDS